MRALNRTSNPGRPGRLTLMLTEKHRADRRRAIQALAAAAVAVALTVSVTGGVAVDPGGTPNFSSSFSLSD